MIIDELYEYMCETTPGGQDIADQMLAHIADMYDFDNRKVPVEKGEINDINGAISKELQTMIFGDTAESIVYANEHLRPVGDKAYFIGKYCKGCGVETVGNWCHACYKEFHETDEELKDWGARSYSDTMDEPEEDDEDECA